MHKNDVDNLQQNLNKSIQKIPAELKKENRTKNFHLLLASIAFVGTYFMPDSPKNERAILQLIALSIVSSVYLKEYYKKKELENKAISNSILKSTSNSLDLTKNKKLIISAATQSAKEQNLIDCIITLTGLILAGACVKDALSLTTTLSTATLILNIIYAYSAYSQTKTNKIIRAHLPKEITIPKIKKLKKSQNEKQ